MMSFESWVLVLILIDGKIIKETYFTMTVAFQKDAELTTEVW